MASGVPSQVHENRAAQYLPNQKLRVKAYPQLLHDSRI